MAGTAISITDFSAFLKERNTEQELAQMIQDGADDPYYMEIRKDTSMGGTDMKVPVVTSTNVRVGASFSGAQGRNSNVKGYAFKLTGVEVYSIASWPTKTLRQSRGSKNSFEQVVDQEVDMATRGLSMKLCTQIYRNGTGSVTTVNAAATVASTTLLLAYVEDVHLFEVNDTVAASAADGGTLHAGTGNVTGIDLNLGALLTTGTNWSTQITGLGVGDFIYRAGGDDAANNGAHVCIEGFQSWVPPSTATLSSSFFSVVRSSYQSKLAGLFYDNTTTTDALDEACVKFASQLHANGARKGNRSLITAIVVHPRLYAALTNTHSSKLHVISGTDGQTDARIGMAKFGLITDYGVIPIKQSIFAQMPYFFFIAGSTWTLYSAGELGLIDDGDGLPVARSPTADEWEARFGGIDLQLGCNAPGWNGIMKVNVPS